MSVKEVKLVKVSLRTESKESLQEFVATETPVSLHLNGEHLVTIMASPEKLKELALGFLVGEGIVKSKEDVRSLEVEDSKVRVETRGSVELRVKAYQTTRLVTTACGSIEDFVRLLDRLDQPRVSSQLRVRPEVILQIVGELNQKAQVFRLTGGTHAALVYSTEENRTIAFAEDVGRHSAVDKVVGEALQFQGDLGRCLLASTGRLSGDIVMKASRVGIPIISSIAGPLYSGVMAAEKVGSTLVCFVRGRRMNVYTYPERIAYP